MVPWFEVARRVRAVDLRSDASAHRLGALVTSAFVVRFLFMERFEPGGSPIAANVPLAVVDRDLPYGLDPGAVELAQAVSVPVHEVGKGRWMRETRLDDFAYVVLEGLVLRTSSAEGREMTELAASGEMLGSRSPLPSDFLSDAPCVERWSAATDALVAVISRRQIETLMIAPALTMRIFERIERAAENMRFTLSLAPVPRLADRIYLLLWHYAERWGSRRDGVTYLELPVNQLTMAGLIGANRSSVSLALKDLAQSGRATCSGRRTWSLPNARWGEK